MPNSMTFIAGYTVTIIGQSDADRIFHVRAIGVSTNSNERVGTFYFRAWSARVPLFQPRAYLGDGAPAYANAAAVVFDSIRDRLMCFAHVYKVRSILPIRVLRCHGIKVHCYYGSSNYLK